MKIESGKRLSAGAGLLLMTALADRMTASFRELGSLRFTLGENGKPYLTDYPQVHFNLSHSGNRVMCAVSAHACGCDVEQISHKKKQIDMVIRCLAESEQRLAAVSAVHFYRIWTLKESILKLSGEGIVIPLNSFEVSLDPPAVRQDFFPEPILLKEYDTLQDEYCCALALSGGELPETMTEVDLGKVLEMC
jgi:4'-phosphopantetheinyl transferase